MFRQFYTRGKPDRSPLRYYKMNFLRARVRDTFEHYMDYKRSNPVRINSNHLVFRLLQSLNVQFDGDLFNYMSKVESKVKSLGTVNKLTSPFSKGDIHDSVFYPDTKEVISFSRSNVQPMDLWVDWRGVAPITVSRHPFTNLTIFDVMVVNKPKTSRTHGIAYINIDIALMAAQYRMFKATYKDGTLDQYVGQVVVPAFMKSHLDLVLFNRVLHYFGLIPANNVKTNLPFMQPNLDGELDRITKDLFEDLVGKVLHPRQILSSIPTLYHDDHILNRSRHTDMMIAQQSIWLLHSQAIPKAKLVLEVFKRKDNPARILQLIVDIRRNDVRLKQEGWYRNGLRKDTEDYIMEEWEELMDLLPEDSFESILLDSLGDELILEEIWLD